MRVVLDTNTFVSALIARKGRVAPRLWSIIATHEVVHSRQLIAELAEVLARPKLRRLVTAREAAEFLDILSATTIEVDVTHRVAACRDPKDNKILALTLSASAQVIVSGDRDLLVLDPFRGIRIVAIADFVALLPKGPPAHSP